MPVTDQAAEQSGIAQERGIGGSRSADHNVISAARAGVPAVEHEFFGAQACLTRFFVKDAGIFHQLVPTCGGMHVHFDHAGIGRHLDHVHARIEGRRIALDEYRNAQVSGRVFDRGHQFQIVFEIALRRHEQAQIAIAHLRAKRGAHRSRA